MRRTSVSQLITLATVASLAALLPTLPIPMAFANSLVPIITRITNWIVELITAVALLTIVVAGLRLVASQGDSGQMETAKKAIIYALIGLVVVAMANTIIGLANEAVG